MIRFIVVFLVCLLVLFTAELLQPVQAHVIMPFTAGVAHVSAWVMLLFDHGVIAATTSSARAPAAASRSWLVATAWRRC